MKKIIGKVFEFDAAHKLPDDEVYGKCSNLHGHRYQLHVEVTGEIDEYGWICNFTDLKSIIKSTIIDKYDHAYLNDFMAVPTVENLIEIIFSEIEDELQGKTYQLCRLKLFETNTCYAELCK
jgi:6-pyruvoyltetrahydropterin/6-carboxytetrahydropterin synthase